MLNRAAAAVVLAFVFAAACSERETPGGPTAPIPEGAPSAMAPFVHVAQPVSAPADDRGGQPRVHNAASVLPPTPVTPVEGQTTDGLRPTFRVNNPSVTGGDDTVIIELQIARNRGFRPVEISVALRARSRGNTDLRPARDLKAGTRYYWRARGVAGSRSSTWSVVRSFQTRSAEGGVTPDRPDHPHLHEGLDGHFHRTLIYGDGHRAYNPDTGEWDADCENGEIANFQRGDARCIDHRYWFSWIDEAPERLRIVVDVTEVHERADGASSEPTYRPSRRCRISDLRYAGGGRYLGGERLGSDIRRFADDTPRLIREATGRAWQGGPVQYRRPGAPSHPETVVVRFVYRGCVDNPTAAACATYGSGGHQEVVVDDNCQIGVWKLLHFRELFAHELGHTLGFRHPDSNDDRDEMHQRSYNGRAGFSRREQIHMRHAFAHGRGYRGIDGRHLEGPRRPRRLEWVYD